MDCVDRVRAELPELYNAAFNQWYTIVAAKYEQQSRYMRGRATVKGVEGLSEEQQAMISLARRGQLEAHLESVQTFSPQSVQDFRAEVRKDERYRDFLRRASDAYDREQDQPEPPETDTWFLALHWWDCGFWMMTETNIANALRRVGRPVASIGEIVSELHLPKCSHKGSGVFRERPMLRIEIDGSGVLDGRFATSET